VTCPVQSRSMTGFGSALVQDDLGRQSWEVRTVNARYLEIRWRLPGFCRRLEHVWEKIARSYLSRGRVEVSLDLRLSRPDVVCPILDTAQALGMLKQVRALADQMKISFQPDLNQLFAQATFWRDPSGDLPDLLVDSLTRGLREALNDVQESRSREGQILREDILARLESMRRIAKSIHEQVVSRAPKRMQDMRERVDLLLKNVSQGLETPPVVLDEPRLLQEIALIADRLDVSEELTRLFAHVEESVRILTELPDPGRRLDFLFQECLREITTCGNKTQDADISRDVVSFKAELEKCREQVQNLE